MTQVLRNRQARCGIEILRTGEAVVMAVLDDDCTVALKTHPTSWREVGEQYTGGVRFFNFDEEWRPLYRHGPQGIEPYPVLEATRKFIRGCYSEPTGFKGGALDALIDVLPAGDVHLFVRGVGFVGRFAALEDAQLIAGAMKVDRPIIFSGPIDLLELPVPDLSEIVMALDPEYRWPSKFNHNHAQGVFEMAKKAVKKKAKKVERAEAAQRRADGPVAKAREKFDELYKANPDTPSSDYIAACEKLGINRGTATTQLGRWRKEKGIAVKRGGARKKKDDKSSAAKSDKKSSKKKPAAESKPGIPPSKVKGEKRHKANPGTSDKSSASPPASPPPFPGGQQAQTPSSPGSSASASGAAASAGTPASTAPAAGSPTTAGGAPTKK